jgi:hypothetical protein
MRRSHFALLGLVLLFGTVAGAGDSTVPTDFATIQAAINDAGTVAGDTITILAGVHNEANIQITKAVTVAGSGMGVTDVQGGAGTNVFYPKTDGVTIRDLTISNSSQGIRFESAGNTIDGTTILRVQTTAMSSRGIEVHNATTVTGLLVEDSVFDGSGLRVSSSGHVDGAQFLNSAFNGGLIGLYVANDGGTSTVRNVLVQDCTFRDFSDTAVFLEEVADTEILNNQFFDNNRDINLFKWYQASVKVSNVKIRGNTMIGTTNAVIAMFNAHHTSGQTEFDDVIVRNNDAVTDPSIVRVVYAGAHSWSSSSTIPSLGGIGWDTVRIFCNNFTGYPAPGGTWGVDLWNPQLAGDTLVVPVGQELGGAQLNVSPNWWGVDDYATVLSLMEVPSATKFVGFLDAPRAAGCPQQPLFVELESLDARRTSEGVVVRWSTLREVDNVGFRVLRGRLGEGVEKSSLEVATPMVIHAAGTETYGADYEYRDRVKSGAGQVFYFLEDIDRFGEVRRHGPVFVDSPTRHRARKR